MFRSAFVTRDKPLTANVSSKPIRAVPLEISPIVAEACSRLKQDLIILPTEKCNFRCTYCYEDFSIGKMSREVQQSLENFMSVRIPELRVLTIKWFGGEPLVAKDVVLRLSSHAKRICDDNGVRLYGGLTTNAWFLEYDLFEELVSNDQRFFQVTLDGWREKHDVTRRLGNGSGTFERIWAHLLEFRGSSLNFEVQLRIHVKRGGEEDLKVLVTELAREFGLDSRFSLDFEHLRDLGGPGGKSVLHPLTLSELRVIEQRLRNFHETEVVRIHGARNRSLGIGAEMTASGPNDEAVGPDVCYASKPNSLLIRADGRIGKCTVALTDDRNTIGRIKPDGSLEIDSAKLRSWTRGMLSLDPAELGCPLSGLHLLEG